MKAAFFSPVPYLGPAERGRWPVPVQTYSPELAERSMQASLDRFQLADELGFDWVTVAEHHFAPMSLTPNPMVLAGALTQRVKRAQIALLGANIPILNPVRVAEEFAMLDTMTGGRLVAGMLRGTSNEYVTYNVNPAESRDRFEEALQLIIHAWTEPQPFGWQGRYFQYRAVSIWPRPVQQPHPPIYMSGSSPESAEMAARNHVRLGFAVTNVPLAKQSAIRYREHARAHGWDPTPDDVLYRVTIHVAETDEQAFEDLEPTGAPTAGRAAGFATSNMALDDAAARLGYYGQDEANQRARIRASAEALRERVATGQYICGGPDAVVAQIQHIHDELGAGVLDLVFAGGTPEKSLRAMELFGERALPRIREM